MLMSVHKPVKKTVFLKMLIASFDSYTVPYIKD